MSNTLDKLIEAEKIVRQMLELEPPQRAQPEYSEALQHLLNLIADAVDQLQSNGNS